MDGREDRTPEPRKAGEASVAPSRLLRALIDVVAIVGAGSTALGIAVPLGAWMAARYTLGHPPQPMVDDPSRVSALVNQLKVLWLEMLPGYAIIAVLSFVLLLFFAFFRAQRKRACAGMLLLLALWGAHYLLLMQDVFGLEIGVWLLD